MYEFSNVLVATTNPFSALRYLSGISSHCAWRVGVFADSLWADGCCHCRRAALEAVGWLLEYTLT